MPAPRQKNSKPSIEINRHSFRQKIRTKTSNDHPTRHAGFYLHRRVSQWRIPRTRDTDAVRRARLLRQVAPGRAPADVGRVDWPVALPAVLLALPENVRLHHVRLVLPSGERGAVPPPDRRGVRVGRLVQGRRARHSRHVRPSLCRDDAIHCGRSVQTRPPSNDNRRRCILCFGVRPRRPHSSHHRAVSHDLWQCHRRDGWG